LLCVNNGKATNQQSRNEKSHYVKIDLFNGTSCLLIAFVMKLKFSIKKSSSFATLKNYTIICVHLSALSNNVNAPLGLVYDMEIKFKSRQFEFGTLPSVLSSSRWFDHLILSIHITAKAVNNPINIEINK
jgi:hypothetical protein